MTWILKTIHDLGLDPPPAVGVMPLGTGNDLSLSFGWGNAFLESWIKSNHVRGGGGGLCVVVWFCGVCVRGYVGRVGGRVCVGGGGLFRVEPNPTRTRRRGPPPSPGLPRLALLACSCTTRSSGWPTLLQYLLPCLARSCTTRSSGWQTHRWGSWTSGAS